MGSLVYVLATDFGLVYFQRPLSNIWLSSSAQWECCICKVCSVMAPKEASKLLWQLLLDPQSWVLRAPQCAERPIVFYHCGECSLRAAWWAQAPLGCLGNVVAVHLDLRNRSSSLSAPTSPALGRPDAAVEDTDSLPRPHFGTWLDCLELT